MPGDLSADWGFPNPATPQGSASYYGIRFAPRRLRDPLAALHGWHWEVRGLLDRVSDPGVAATKLAWWREELARCFDGQPTHPLGTRLAAVIREAQLPPKPFLDIAWSTEAVLARHWPKDQEELTACARQDLGALFELILRVHTRLGEGGGDPNQAQIDPARRLGAYCTLVYAIRDSGRSLRQGRLGPFPADGLRSEGLGMQDMLGVEGRHRLPRLLERLAQTTEGLKCDDPALAALPVTLRIRARILDCLLAELRAEGFDLADRRIGLTPWRKLGIAWRESWRRRAPGTRSA